MTTPIPTELGDLIAAHIDSFNAQDDARLVGLFGKNAVVIDGIAPFYWPSPNAPANWVADVAKWRETFGVTAEKFTYDVGFWSVEGSSAYASVDGTLTVTMKGQDVVRTGILAYTFTKRDGGWEIDAQAWARTS
jgi:hypothetical protein